MNNNNIHQWTQDWARKNHLPVFLKNEVDSTNRWAKEDFKDESFSLYLSDLQTQGRGRGSNTWTQSEPGSTLLSTWCLRLAKAPHPLLSLRIGLSLYHALQTTWPERPWALKAPNDIYLNDGKFAGLLIEVVPENHFHRLFVGLGANIFSKPEISTQKTSHLNEQSPIDVEHWRFFSTRWWNALLGIAADASRDELSVHEQSRLLEALKKYSANQIANIDSQGSLTLLNGDKVHWLDL